MNKKYVKISVVLIAIALIVCPFCYYQNNHISVTEYSVASSKISPGFDGYRIVQISDLHNKEFGRDNRNLIERIRELNPDIIVITGDIIDSGHTDMESAVSFVKNAALIAPVYYITGNHEYWIDEDMLTDMFQKFKDANAVILRNSMERLEKESGYITLAGLDNNNLTDSTLKDMNLESDDFNILLAHEPQNIKIYASCPVDLCLSGHAHGGQFRLPFTGGLIAPDQGFNPEYTEGMHEENGMKMIISRGLGNSIIPLRLFNTPEIVCVTLCSE